MSSEQATPAAATRMPADLPGRDAGLSLAGLLGVLHRADEVLVRHRPRPDRSAVHRSGAYRPGAYRRGPDRRVPLRPVPQAPSARSAPAASLPAVPAVPARPVQREQRPAGLRALARRLTRRLALWGAGPGGEYLAWRSSAPRSSARGTRPDADRPVVLREMPSTPTIQPAASSPAAALLPRGPASSAGPQGAGPVSSGAGPVPGVRPGGRLERSEATGWPSPARLSPAATGLVRARGDPLSCPVRGSPLPERRSRSPGSA
jgi:hypothetical protein